MNSPDDSPDKDEQLPEQLSKALAADTSAPSAQTDQIILQFAAQHAPSAPSARWKTWMPAAAACSLVGVLTLSLLPERQLDPSQRQEMDMDVGMQAAKSRQAVGKMKTQAEAAFADSAPAHEPVLEESERRVAAPAANFKASSAQAQSPAKTAVVQLPPELFERLLALGKQENSLRDFSGGLAQSRPGGLTLPTAKKLNRGIAEADSSPMMHTNLSQADDNNTKYETLRTECNCGLPESLQQALDMLASEQIQAGDEPRATDDKQ